MIADIEPRKRSEAERQSLLRRLGQAQEDERRRIALELHDQVGQTVTGLSLGLKRLEQMLDASPKGGKARECVRWLQSLAVTLGKDVHRTASDLRPAALDDLGLAGALTTYVSDWSARYGLPVDFQVTGGEGRLPGEIETTVYRIVQEALTNILKHAGARRVSIVLDRGHGHLTLIIEDDGTGFDAEAALNARNQETRGCLGLTGIRERLLLFDGSLSIELGPDAGTTLFVRIPLIPTSARIEP